MGHDAFCFDEKSLRNTLFRYTNNKLDFSEVKINKINLLDAIRPTQIHPFCRIHKL